MAIIYLIKARLVVLDANASTHVESQIQNVNMPSIISNQQSRADLVSCHTLGYNNYPDLRESNKMIFSVEVG